MIINYKKGEENDFEKFQSVFSNKCIGTYHD